MKKTIACLALACLLSAVPVWAAPDTINYQGKLTDASGPVSDTVVMTFGVYDAETGGNLLYQEIHTSVQVTGGIYTVHIGSGTATADGTYTDIPSAVLSSTALWLEVAVNGDALSPRSEITTAPTAILANEADFAVNADTVDNKHADEFALKTDLSSQYSGITVDWTNVNNLPQDLADGDDVDDADSDPNNEIQTVSRSGTDITLSNSGGTVSVADNDNSATNELQTLGLSGSTLSLTNGGSVNVDPSSTNEIQSLSVSGTNLTLSNGGGTVSVADNDNDSTNERNTSVTMSGTTLSVNDSGGAKSIDLAEKLSINDLVDARGIGYSVFLGSGAGINDDGSDNYNIGIGDYALNKNTSGGANLAMGLSALNKNTSGNSNLAMGVSALNRNTSGNNNLAMGVGALYYSSAGYSNLALGTAALYYNTTGDTNLAIGDHALGHNTTGNANVGIGVEANFFNENGSNNTIIGHQAGSGTGLHYKSGNVFLGYKAGYYETGSNKLYIDNSDTSTPLIHGDFASNALTVNGTLTATGALTANGALTAGTLTAADNTAIGTTVSSTKKLAVLAGSGNTYAGWFRNEEISHNTVGLYGNASGIEAAGSPATHFGVQAYASGAATNFGIYAESNGGTTNYAGYFEGDVRVTGNISYYGTITDISDQRLKENIRPVENALAKVEAINGVYFTMKDNPEQTEVGVIAQDVQKVLPEAVSVIDKENGYLGVSYPSLIPVLIEAVKELKSENETKDAKITALLTLVCQYHPEAALCQ